MAYEKRVCVLKQIRKGFSADGSALTGVVYAERMGSELTLTPRIAGLAPVKEGKYVLVFHAEGKFFFAPLAEGSIRMGGAPSVKRGFGVLLAFVRGEAEPVAFGCCGEERGNMDDYLSALGEDGRKKPIPTPMPPTETPSPIAPNVPYAPGVPLPGKEEEAPFREQAAAYDDEAIAASDYFLPHADEEGETGRGAEEKEDAGGGDPDAHGTVLFPRGSLTYYKEVRERLDEVLKSHPQDTRLLWAFPQSRWVRSPAGLIGIVYEGGIPRYLCVAAEGECPEEMKEDAVFVPSTPFSEEAGFWVVFQDADTGGYVKVGKE